MSFNASLLYQKYQGQTLSYDGIPANAGQCVQWAEYVLTDGQYGYGLQPFYGNAIDWWNNFGGVLSKNFVKVSDGTIKQGDFVIFNQNVGSVYGHIDMAMSDGTYNQFTGADSNWAGNLTVHLVNHVGAQYIIGTLRPKGTSQDMPITKEQEMVCAQLSTGSLPGKDYNYPYVGTTDVWGMLTFWYGQANKMTKETENALAVMQTGSLPGKDYSYPNVGKCMGGANDSISFWFGQPRGTSNVTPVPGLTYSGKQLYTEE